MPLLYILAIVVIIIILILLGIIAANYKKSGPQAALIVYGSGLGSKGVNKDSQGNRLKVVRGSGTFVYCSVFAWIWSGNDLFHQFL